MFGHEFGRQTMVIASHLERTDSMDPRTTREGLNQPAGESSHSKTSREQGQPAVINEFAFQDRCKCNKVT
jgi:hypothetical protein